MVDVRETKKGGEYRVYRLFVLTDLVRGWTIEKMVKPTVGGDDAYDRGSGQVGEERRD